MMLPSVSDYVSPGLQILLPFCRVLSASFYYDFLFFFSFLLFLLYFVVPLKMMVINLGLRLWYSKMNIYAAFVRIPMQRYIGVSVRYTQRHGPHVTHTQPTTTTTIKVS